MNFLSLTARVISRASLRPLPLLVLVISVITSPHNAKCAEPVELNDFDVVIAGGSTAAFAAALASANSGAKTALLEPTDWIGGQLTSSGVPAVDEAWHTILDVETKEPLLNVAKIARDPRNITPSFRKSLEDIADCGDCWVSRFCFRPKLYLEQQLLPLQHEAGENLTVFLETVVKQVEVDAESGQILSLTAIRRAPAEKLAAKGYDRLPSEDLPDWYSPEPSERFSKEVLRFGSHNGRPPVFVDATEWGELLALSGADYLLGAEDSEGEPNGHDHCGQATVFCFVQELHTRPQQQMATDQDLSTFGYADYNNNKENPWELIWTYRRIHGQDKPAPGDLCLQNWGYSGRLKQGGNDYPFGFLFKTNADTEVELADWQGGIDLEVLSGAEQRAFGWHEWFRQNAPPPLEPDQITLNGAELGTGHGLAKLPYIRDTRRSIGLDGFVLKFDDLSGPASQVTGTQFPDRIALGAYAADIHPLVTCSYPAHTQAAHDTLPFYLPFRALTHYRFGNLLVTGKTMAQSFLANSATRLHPIEWSTGTAAGVAAAYMAETRQNSRQTLENIEKLQARVKVFTPIDWTIPD
ncbi:FAD-dependent oxidoreductase [Bythopirellula polymerisocia]|uniref:FAD dependent oxidoreductase n=1 Tax=Bythopirellula polymerisocia TaxID=2528003 RepID=A0A5C6CJJ9_9BACT|nr:FAD-dependent oxidoreductase [Bythopirellula polymerisocia]TWU23654.1 FAD dependent oxidoreductase [Bythopirellula polymerisocia]